MTAEAAQPKVAEIEDLADELERVTAEAKSWADKKKDVTENLIASMKRHKVWSYSRYSWGVVTVEDGKPKVKVKKQAAKEGAAS